MIMADIPTVTPMVNAGRLRALAVSGAQRSPALALELLRAAGAVMAIRFRATLARKAPVT